MTSHPKIFSTPGVFVGYVCDTDLYTHRYLLIQYYLGELISKVNDSDRREVLTAARQKYETYLDLLDSCDILSSDEKKLYEQYLDNPDSFTTASTTDPAARRAVKIVRYKHEKELKQKLEVGRGFWHPPGLQLMDLTVSQDQRQRGV